MDFVIRMHWEKWLQDSRAQAMFNTLPFGIDLLIGIMFECWWALSTEPHDVAYGLVCDMFDAYSIEDVIIESTGLSNPMEINASLIDPYYDLIVEIVYDLYLQSHNQLLPLFSSPQNVGQLIPTFGGMGSRYAILQMNQTDLPGQCDVGRPAPAASPIALPTTDHL